MRTIVLLSILIVLGGCLVSPSKQFLGPDGVDVSKGSRYFLRECGRCHDLVYPEEHSIGEWQKILARKKAKVSLTRDQFAELEQFIYVHVVHEGVD